MLNWHSETPRTVENKAQGGIKNVPCVVTDGPRQDRKIFKRQSLIVMAPNSAV